MGPDSVLHRVLDKFSDVVVVSAVMVACCALIFPGGRAVRASTLVWLTDPPHPIRTFFCHLRQPGGAVTWWWLITVAIHIVAVVEWLSIDHFVVRAGLLSGLLLVSALFVWLVPVAALNAEPGRALLSTALVLFISHLGRTCGALGIVVVKWGILVALLPHSLFFGFLAVGVAQYCIALITAPPLGCSAEFN